MMLCQYQDDNDDVMPNQDDNDNDNDNALSIVNTKRQICQEGDGSEGACRRARHLRLSDSTLLTRQDQ